jgi:hypothetical protein
MLLACTTTVTRSKNPVFAAPMDSLQAGLNRLIVFEHINLDGEEVTTNGKPSTRLQIEVLNGKDIPENGDRLKALAHSLAAGVKDALKDKNEYENYTVLFVKVESSAGVTKRNWKEVTFKSGDL